ncbi:hypothetical protein [Microbacterium sp. No. 7]|uniref:hypothetical protein n=1 Tax=Microbacterium sp. No. 7 TaxID=1714373 RepID=UPI0006D0A351|nr:hypothetical protein [Microbacterium sp. No. 7]ALJ20319.1 hypothetical protein AOA12_10510 [Microbacterium sp. No. 7]
MSGRISLLVSRDMRVLVEAVRSLDPEVRKQLRAHTKQVAQPLWKDELAQHTGTRLQNRVLTDTARVSVTDMQITLKTAQVGKVSSGAKASQLAGPAEFGMSPSKTVTQRSRRGRQYTRRMGNVFGPPRRKGYVFFPTVRAAIPRVASLWWQTAYRTIAETIEKAGN